MSENPGAHELGHLVEQQIQQWQEGLFLETYSASYVLSEESETELSLTGDVFLRFAGWREDLWGRWLQRFNANHMLIYVTIDADRRKLTNFSYSNGEAFGYDEPLRVTEWPTEESKLIQVCNGFGGNEFKELHNVSVALVSGTAARPGRAWTLDYNGEDSAYFTCLINIDTGAIHIKREESDWHEVGNLYQTE